MNQEGVYFGKLSGSGTAQLDNDKKTPYIWLNFKCKHIASGGAWNELPDPINAEVRLFLSEAAFPYTAEKLEAMGFNGDFGNPGFNEAYTKTGTNVRCSHQDNPNGGKPFEQWELLEWGKKEKKPLESNDIRTFNARYKTVASTAKKPEGAPTPPVPEAEDIENNPLL